MRTIHRRCPVCGWWQLRADDETSFMYTPCNEHTEKATPVRLLKVDVVVIE